MTVLYQNLCHNEVCYKGISVGCHCPCLVSLLIECSPFIMLCLGSIKMDRVISKSSNILDLGLDARKPVFGVCE